MSKEFYFFSCYFYNYCFIIQVYGTYTNFNQAWLDLKLRERDRSEILFTELLLINILITELAVLIRLELVHGGFEPGLAIL